MLERVLPARVLFVLLPCLGCAGGGNPTGTDAGPLADETGVPAALDLAAGESDRSAAWPVGKYLSVDEVYARVQAGDVDMLLVNVVDPEYYSLGFVAGSLKIPWNALDGRLAEVDRARHVVVYCRKGVRSESAYTTLANQAFPFVWIMEGGIERWIGAGYPVVAD